MAGVSKKFGVHRRMVREAVGSAIPQLRKKTKRRRFKLAPVAGFIDQILESDRKAPRKQRHTAYRIWKRICAELPENRVCERTVRFYVQERKSALWPGRSRDICAAELPVGLGGAGRLV